MNRLFVILLLALAACTTTPLLDQETAAMKAVTIARQSSVSLLQAGKISYDREVANKAIFDGMAASIKAAVAANNPAAVASTKAAAEKFDPAKGQ